MDPLRLLDLLRGLDGRSLHRAPGAPQGWDGQFEGVIRVVGARVLENNVLFTLTVPVPTVALPGMTVRILQSGNPLALTPIDLRTDSPVGGTDAAPANRAHFRFQTTVPSTEANEPLVVEIVAPDNTGAAVATAVGWLPPREDLNSVLTTSVITRPLLQLLEHAGPDEPFDVVIDVNLDAGETRSAALASVQALIARAIAGFDSPSAGPSGEVVEQYAFERLTKSQIEAVVRADRQSSSSRDLTTAHRARSIHRIWPDFHVHALLDRSVVTIKADAARSAFSAAGRGITWAVIDSGIDARHPHFEDLHNLTLDDSELQHQDFLTGAVGDAALVDEFGHGTHVAGIIAGRQKHGTRAYAGIRERTHDDEVVAKRRELHDLHGVAPECSLLSLRVLDDCGNAPMKRIMQAINYVNQVNNYGRDLRVHGVNLSLGYDFEAEWFACGQSPLCIEVDRLVSTGVVVVIAAGNTGYASLATSDRPANVGLDVTINDPGNAEHAITVGSTHASAPHTYGVSYYSSKGPTGDGRMKPDLIAPGERIVSCAAGTRARVAGDKSRNPPRYVEDSGTSMAAPHVSGAAAAFLSIRREFIGQPETVKRLFMDTATDLGRDRYFQGCGLLDLMRAIQAV